MAKIYLGSPIYSLTPAEERELNERAVQNSVLDADVQDTIDAPLGRMEIGARNSMFGGAIGRAVPYLVDVFDGGYSAPLNLTRKKSEADPIKDDFSIFNGNDPETIAEEMRNVPEDEWPWVLSSGDYNTYRRRLRYVLTAQPEAQQQGSMAGFVLGMSADISAMIATGVAAEGVALAGFNTAALAGRAGASSLGIARTQSQIATAVAEATNAVSRTNMALRWTALGAGENLMWEVAHQGLDPTYDPTFGDVAESTAYSAVFSGALGGAVFGRQFVRDRVTEMVLDLRRKRVTNLPGGYTISYTDGFLFDAPAAADQMLFAPGTGSFQYEAERIAGDLWTDWQRSPKKVDLFLPGTRSVSLPVLDEAAAARLTGGFDIGDTLLPKATGEVRDALGRIPARPKMGQVVGLRSAIKATAFELSLAGQKLDAKVFSTIAKALVRAEKTRTRAGAFNKVFWEELSKDLDPEVVSNLRKVGERTFIPGIDRSVIDLSQRDDMVDAVLEGFRAKQHLVKGEEPSLIFRVLQQIKDRNGLVTRKVVEDVVDELRKVSQNPPKTRNAKGAEILDRNARRAAIVQIINKHSKSDKAIFLPPSLLNNMNPAVAAAKGANRITRLGTADPLGTAQDASDAPRNKVRLPFGLGQMFNQSAVAHESNNGWARLVANLSFFARRDMGTAQQYTIFEEGSHKMYSLMGMFVKGYRNGFIKFALGNGTEDVTRQVGLSDALVTAFKDNKMTREYNRRVLQQLRTGAYDDALSAVNDGARGIREMFNRVHELAHAAGLPGFTKAAVNNYFPRMWRWDKVRRLATTKEGRAALESLIRQSIDQNGRRVIIDGVETAFEGDIDDAAKAFSERLIAIAEGTENAPLVQQEQELFDAITRLEGPLKAKAGSKTPYGRSRMLLNESSEVAAGDLLGAGKNTLSIADLTNDDMPFVVRKYITSVMGAVNEKRLLDAFNAEMKARGILKPTTVKKGEEVAEDLTVDSVDKMLAMVKKLGGTLEAKHESALREIIAAMRYEPIHHGRTATTDRIMSILMPYGYLTTGGQFGLAQIGEIARIVGTLGVSNTIKQMPILMEMISNWKNLDQDTKGMSVFLNQWFSPSTDRLRRTMVQGLSDMQPDDYGSLVARGTTATARYLDKAANLMSDVSLLAPFQSFTQQLTAAATLQHMMEAARGATKWLDDSTVRTLGLEPEQYRALAKWVSDNAEEANGRIVGISKPDAVEMDKLVKLVDRMVRTRIQDIPTRGDFAKGMFSALGRMMLQFRTFNLKGVDNFLLQNSSRVVSGAPGAKAKVASEIGATLVIAGSIQWLRNAADWASYKASGDTEKADEVEERMTWDGFARGAMTGPSEFFVPIMLTDAFTQTFVSKDPIFSPYRYSGLSLYSFPSFALAKRAAGLGTDIYGSTVGQALGLDLEREVTQSTIHKARLLMPFQNLIGLKQYFNILEQDIVDYYNLPEIQPRNRE